MKTIYERLEEYGNSDYYGFHMPGHKRNMDIPGHVAASRIDITEIDGFDDLHHTCGKKLPQVCLSRHIYE